MWSWSLLVDAQNNEWWINLGATIHIADAMHGFLNQRKPTINELSIYLENQMCSNVDTMGTFRLVLKTSF